MIGYDRQSDSISIDWPQSHTDHLVERAKLVFDRVTQANGVDYRDDLFEGKAFAPNTVHPLGGCVRGAGHRPVRPRATATTTCTSTTPRCIPGYIGCNPFMTITALAERNIEAILAGRR